MSSSPVKLKIDLKLEQLDAVVIELSEKFKHT